MENTEANCREVVERLFLYIDGEIAGGDVSSIELHLRRCAPCLDHVTFERDLKELVHRKCASEATPPELSARLKEHLRHFLDENPG
ncbi:MAG: mycothiol system anti-sigma-R factor [Actinomycetota bacterium]